MFNFLKKKKQKRLVIECDTDVITVNSKPITFPTNYNTLVNTFGKPDRKLNKSKNYIIWDKLGVFCGYADKDNILSISFYQNKQDRTEYNTKKQFTGKLILNNEEITNNEFSKIPLGELAILRLGSETKIRFGFSIGVNKTYNN